MAHKTLIEATGYEVQAGKTLIEGTAYTQKKGRALVNGTGYDVEFSHPVSLSVIGLYDAEHCYFSVDGQRVPGTKGYYYSGDLPTSPVEMEIQSDQVLSVYVCCPDASNEDNCVVILNKYPVQKRKGEYILDIEDCATVSVSFSMRVDNQYVICEITTA